MTGRESVELDIRFRIDLLEPVVDGSYRHNPVVTSTVADYGEGTSPSSGGTPSATYMPLVIVRDLAQVDELALGHCVAMLLVNREQG